MKKFAIAIVALLILPLNAWCAEDKPTDNMAILSQKIKADKRFLVSSNMQLSEAEAAKFWPIYDDYQKDLHALNERIGKALQRYAAAYNAGPVKDEDAQWLINESLMIKKEESKLLDSLATRLGKVLPPPKVARYLQIERKIRAVIDYQLADQIPLVQ